MTARNAGGSASYSFCQKSRTASFLVERQRFTIIAVREGGRNVCEGRAGYQQGEDDVAQRMIRARSQINRPEFS